MPQQTPPDVEALQASRDVDGLIAALGYQKDKNIRLKAAQALGHVGDDRAVAPLLAAHFDVSWSVHEAAGAALAQIGAAAVEPLLNALEDNNREVRVNAARALAEIGDDRAVAPLTALLADDHERVRQEAAEALKTLEAKRTGQLRLFLVDFENPATETWAGYNFYDAVRRAGYEPSLDGILRIIAHVEELTAPPDTAG